MEGCRQLDAVSGTAGAQPLIRRGVLVFFLGCSLLWARAQSPIALSTVKQLAEEQRWPELASLAQGESSSSAEVSYYYGIALSRLGRFEEARRVLLNGRRLEPHDKRFPSELAGVEFKQKRYGEAARWLHRTLALDGEDVYANNFLGTVYFLNDNLEAALKYWNKLERPHIETLKFEPTPRTRPVVLDRAFAFAPASTLRLQELLTTEARLSGTEVFSGHRIELAARDDGNFDAVFRGNERNGFGPNKWIGLASFFRGIFMQTVYPEYFNIGGTATNFTSRFRWDAQKRRVMATISGPWKRDPKWRYRIGTELRNENWDIRSSFSGDAAHFAFLNLRRQRVAAGITEFVSGRWSWTTGVEFSHRDFRDFTLLAPPTPGLFPEGIFSQGYQLKQLTGLNYEVLRVPEKRFTLTASAASELARLWSDPGQTFAKLRGAFEAEWFPQARGTDYRMQHRIGAGRIVGDAPFDELYILGLERDNELWLRAHVGTHNGRKGSAPFARSYFLSNWEVDKNLYRTRFFNFRLGPFLDTGRVFNPSPGLAPDKWLWDTGVQAKVQALGFGVAFIYGKDLRSGRNAFYATVGR